MTTKTTTTETGTERKARSGGWTGHGEKEPVSAPKAMSPQARAMLEEYRQKAEARAQAAREKMLGRLAELAGAAEEAYEAARAGGDVDMDALWRLVNQIVEERTVFAGESAGARGIWRLLDEEDT